ncbi:MAG TPA: urease accessory protein UreH [Blastocatellia bacterium]|nr:urease accessory protein UreH [Blastocatellia bacterium]
MIDMNAGVLAVLAFGFVAGLKHALDPDHVVAVSAIVSEHKSLARSSLIGTFWGLGHSASLLAVGLLIILLRNAISEETALWMELPVAVMLIVLGARVLVKIARERGIEVHAHAHSHDGELPHKHIHVHNRDAHDHKHYLIRLARRPFAVGMVHGFAGSAAVTLGAMTSIPSVSLGLIYIALFGLGSIGGMLLMSAMIGLPFAVTAGRFSTINSGIRLLAGLFSIGFGLFLAWGLIIQLVEINSN